MKACEKNRKSIAWLALGALEADEVAALHAHLKDCEGCREYFEELSSVTKKLAAAEPDASIPAPAFFHQRLTGRLRATESSSAWEAFMAGLSRRVLTWRVVVPATAILLIAVFVVMKRRPATTVSVVAPPVVVSVAAASDANSDPAPTMANYQMVASQSLSKLDELLTRQGNESLPPAPVYRASTIKLPDTAF